jgi:hypothetical protein
MKFAFEIISMPTKPEDAYSAKAYNRSGVYKFDESATLYFVDKEYGTVNTVYGYYHLYLQDISNKDETNTVDESLVLKLIAASHGKTL